MSDSGSVGRTYVYDADDGPFIPASSEIQPILFVYENEDQAAGTPDTGANVTLFGYSRDAVEEQRADSSPEPRDVTTYIYEIDDPADEGTDPT